MEVTPESYYQDKYQSLYDKEAVNMEDGTVATDLP